MKNDFIINAAPEESAGTTGKRYLIYHIASYSLGLKSPRLESTISGPETFCRSTPTQQASKGWHEGYLRNLKIVLDPTSSLAAIRSPSGRIRVYYQG